METKTRYFPKFHEGSFSRLNGPKFGACKAPKQAFNVSFSEDQEKVYDAIKKWMRNPKPQILTLGGFAGTGKSTLITALAHEFSNTSIAFCALTGKATNVVRGKMREAGIVSHKHSTSTIHSLLYQCYSKEPDPTCSHEFVDGKCSKCKWSGEILWSKKSRDNMDFKYLIVDEGSMLDDEIAGDLASYGIPMLVVGDHAQLPPVAASCSLMENPMLRLEQIHRQALGNPILVLTEIIRKYGQLPKDLPGNDPDRLRYVLRKDFVDEMRQIYKELPREDIGVLCWTNVVRTRINQMLRQVYFEAPDLPETPRREDQVICLKNAFNTAFNGMRGFIESDLAVKTPNFYEGEVTFPDDDLRFRGSINRHAFGFGKSISTLLDFYDKGFKPKDWPSMGFLLDYGYCLTTHKAQGSQFHTAAVIREKPMSASQDLYKRHIYTSVTRAAERLRIVI